MRSSWASWIWWRAENCPSKMLWSRPGRTGRRWANPTQRLKRYELTGNSCCKHQESRGHELKACKQRCHVYSHSLLHKTYSECNHFKGITCIQCCFLNDLFRNSWGNISRKYSCQCPAQPAGLVLDLSVARLINPDSFMSLKECSSRLVLMP